MHLSGCGIFIDYESPCAECRIATAHHSLGPEDGQFSNLAGILEHRFGRATIAAFLATREGIAAGALRWAADR